MPYNSHSIALPSDVFSLALHPSRPLLAAGLASGHLHTYTWPYSEDGGGEDGDEDGDTEMDRVEENGGFKVSWKTKRHKGSCRCIAFSGDGDVLYSSGTDSLSKAASSETGRVFAKSYIPDLSSGKSDTPTTILPLSAYHLLIGADSGKIHLFDTRTPTLSRPSASWDGVHGDYVSSLTALPASGASTTGFSRQFVSTGDTTLAHLDVRKPGSALFKSEDQEDELLCSAFISGLPSKAGRGSEKIITGMASGVVTLWNKGEWADHENRINVAKASGDSVDSVCVLPEGFQVPGKGWGRFVAAGAGDGKVRIVKMGGNGVVATLAHSLTIEEAKSREGVTDDYESTVFEEGVAAIGVDCEGRVVSSGGSVVKVWYWEDLGEGGDGGSKKKRRVGGSDSEEDSEEGEGVEGEGVEGEGVEGEGVEGEGVEGEGEGEGAKDSSENKKEKRKRKRKRGKKKAKSAGTKAATSFQGLD